MSEAASHAPGETARATELSGVARFMKATELDTRMLGMVGALLIIWVVFHFLSGGLFLTPRNLWNLSVQSASVAIMATGMVLVIVTRNIDLSIGSVLGFVGMVMGVTQAEFLPGLLGFGSPAIWVVALLVGVVAGVAIGAFQGYVIAFLKVPAFIVTLGGLLVWRGAAWWVTSGRTVAPMDADFRLMGGGPDGSIGATWSWVFGLAAIALVAFMAWRNRSSRLRHGFPTKPVWVELLLFAVWAVLIVGFVLVMNAYTKPRSDIPRGIPVPVLILIAVVVGMSLISRITRFGRYVFAMGGNPRAAELSGIDVKKTTLLIFVIMGILCGIAAVITTARLNAGANSMGMLAELSVIAAAVIGGTSLAGGVGSIAGAILGAVIMQSLENGMVLMGVSSAMRQVIIGLVLIIAVWFDSMYKKNRR